MKIHTSALLAACAMALTPAAFAADSDTLQQNYRAAVAAAVSQFDQALVGCTAVAGTVRNDCIRQADETRRQAIRQARAQYRPTAYYARPAKTPADRVDQDLSNAQSLAVEAKP